MSEFSCPRCGYKSPYIFNLHKHFNRKNPCLPKICDLPFDKLYQIYYSSVDKPEDKCCQNVAKKFICELCSKEYDHRCSLYKHLQTKHSEHQTVKLESTIKSLQDQVKTLQTKLDMKETIVPTIINHTTNNNTTHNTTHNNTTHNTTNQIVIIENFGSENLEYITDEYIETRLKQPKAGINDIIRQIHLTLEDQKITMFE